MILKRTIPFLALALVVAMPAHAAMLSLSSEPQVGAGKQLVVSVRFVPEGMSVNAVGGSIQIPDGVVVDRIDTAGSALSLFVEAPVYVIADNEVTFLGGAPNGLSSSEESHLFAIYGHARNVGTYEFEPGGAVAYAHDGEGTPVTLRLTGTVLAVDDSSGPQTSPTVTGGTELVIDFGRDASLNNGEYFLAFFGGDKGRGVSHYEVREGWWSPSVRADGSYVLEDQSLHSTIWVSAVAPDGSRVTRIIPALRTDYIAVISVIGLVLLLSIILKYLARMRRPS